TDQFAVTRVQFDKIHQRQIAAESGSCRITADSFVVGNEITAAIENEATIEDFNCFNVMRRVSVDKCNALLNQAMCKHDLITRNFVTPIGAPVNGSDNQIARLLMCAHLIGYSRCARFRNVVEQITPGEML